MHCNRLRWAARLPDHPLFLLAAGVQARRAGPSSLLGPRGDRGGGRRLGCIGSSSKPRRAWVPDDHVALTRPEAFRKE